MTSEKTADLLLCAISIATLMAAFSILFRNLFDAMQTKSEILISIWANRQLRLKFSNGRSKNAKKQKKKKGFRNVNWQMIPRIGNAGYRGSMECGHCHGRKLCTPRPLVWMHKVLPVNLLGGFISLVILICLVLVRRVFCWALPFLQKIYVWQEVRKSVCIVVV